MTRSAWEISAPGLGAVVREPIELPGPDELLITADWGAVSTGSESLVFRGRVPADLSLDDTVSSLQGTSRYPLRYGYTLVGRVSACGDGVDQENWLGRRVFAFHPHASHALVPADQVLPIPDGIESAAAPLYPNLETAVTLHWDAAVLPGESVLVTGLGIVGFLVSMLALERAPALIVAVEPDAQRRRWFSDFLAASGSTHRLPDVAVVESIDAARERVLTAETGARGTYPGFDCAFELSGRVAVLDTVLDAMAFGGRVIVGSWYGAGVGELRLGGRFHRSRCRIVSSQVSTLPVALAGRIDRDRRGRIVWSLLRRLPVSAIPRREIGLRDLPELFGEIVDGIRPEPWIAVRY